MFKNYITETAFTTPDANEFFDPSIPLFRDPSNDDVTLVSTLRALVYPRMKDSGVDRFHGWKISTSARSRNVYEMTNSVISNIPENMLLIHDVTGSDHDKEQAIENAVKILCDADGFEEIAKVHDFYNDAFYTRCVINDEKKLAIVFVSSVDTRKLHYIQCCLPAVLRWFFDPKKGLSDIEMKLIRSFMNSNSEEYMSCLDEMIKSYNLEEGRIHRVLHGFESIRVNRQIASLRSQIEEAEMNIDRYSRAIHSESLNIENLSYTLAGCLSSKYNESDGNTELEDYFLCNKSVDLERGDEYGMTFVATGYVTYYDDDQAETLIKNKRGIIEGAIESIPERELKISSGNIRKLMRKIFVDKEYKLRVCGAFQFTSDQSVNGINRYRYPSKYRTYMPNPHLDRYSCLGDNRRAIERHLIDGDYVYGVEQCISATLSLNFIDTSVMMEFVKRISSDRAEEKFIELPDGKIVSPVEACELINKEG